MLRFILAIALSYSCCSSYAFLEEDFTVLNEKKNTLDSTKEGEEYKPKLKLNIGAYHAYSKASILVQNGDKGTLIDPREDLGFEDVKIIPKAELSYEPSEKHEIAFLFWIAKKNSNATLERDIYYNDMLFPADAKVESQLDVTNYSLTYRYSIFRKEHWKVGVSAGTKLVNFKTKLISTSITSENSTLAPGPMLGLHGTYTIGRKITLKGTAEYFKLELNDWDYKTTDLKGGVEFYPFRNIGIGADYHYMSILYKRDKINSKRTFEYTFDAFSIYLSIRI